MIQLAPKKLCTGCGACAFVCGKNCIVMKENEVGIVYPELEMSNCVQCERCQKVCPIIENVDFRKPLTAYAAWSSNENERATSASGGIASEIYKMAIVNGYLAAGAVINNDFYVSMQLTDSMEDVGLFKNSKYVFSSAIELYPKLRILLKEGKKTVIIGLPCQIAAIRKLFKDNENLLLIDVVCHGTTPYSYLKQHIAMLEKKYGEVAKRMSFRDPSLYTNTFTFTLYNADNKRFYAQRTKDGDTYQFGYHRMVSYRENCYHCKFAKSKRISDITLSDYKGLGTMAPCAFSAQKVSSVLINTDRGKILIESLITTGKIKAEERPVDEPVQGDEQLRRPSAKSKYRLYFERDIQVFRGNFEIAILAAQNQYIRDEKIKKIIFFPRGIVRKLLKVIHV